MRKIWISLITIGVVAGLWLEYHFMGLDLRIEIIEHWPQYGDSPLQIGRTVPYFLASTPTGRSLTPTSSTAKFYVYMLEDRISQACLNLECGHQANKVVVLGGSLMGIPDPAIAALFGIKTIHNPAPGDLIRSLDFAGALRRFRGESLLRFEARLMVVADQYGRISKIFRHATLNDIEEVLRRAGYGL